MISLSCQSWHKHNITLDKPNIPTNINTYNTYTQLQIVIIRTNKHYTVFNWYIPPPDAESHQYATLDIYMAKCIQHIIDTQDYTYPHVM